MESRSSTLARYLLAAYVLLVAYASLHPFSGWRDQGFNPLAYLTAPLPRYFTAFDVVANVLAYFPLGVLIVLTLHPGPRRAVAIGLAVLGAAALSIAFEALQNYLPDRIPSNLDVATNTLGGLLGGVAGTTIAPRLFAEGGLVGLRDRLFTPGSRADLGLVVLGLWLLTQLNPETLLFGTGDLGELLGAATPALHPAATFIRIEAVVAAANLVAASLLAASIVAPGERARVVVLVLVAMALMVRMTAFAILFSPEDALAWATPGALVGLGVGTVLALVALALSRGVAVVLAGLLLMSATVLVNLAPANPYLAHSLAVWRQGHFLNFNGLTRLVSVLWPFAALAWLMLGAEREQKTP